MTAPAKKPAVKKAATKKSPQAAKPEVAEAWLSEDELAALAEVSPPPRDGEIRPVIIGKRGRRGDAPVEMVTLFELDDRPHQIPKNPSAALVLRWMIDLREHGQHGAAESMALTLLGRPALDALAASPDVEVEDVSEIFTNIGAVFFSSDNYRKILAASDPS